ncbi:MAG: prenyltransferase/squalene oxidase repeat-containing protein [Anaerolineae bacterium]
MMIAAQTQLDVSDLVLAEIDKLLHELGQGKTLGTAYDTAWGARLSGHYPDYEFEAAVEWLRRNQNEDGSWGGQLEHQHDRYISTLAAIVTLAEVGRNPRDKRRVQRGETALWKIVGRLGRDDSDTVGFPILSAALATEADALGLDVPRAPIRYAKAYKKKVEALFQQPVRNWRGTSLTYSFEALRYASHSADNVLEGNDSVSISPSATAAYLLTRSDDGALTYLKELWAREGTGAFTAVSPMDLMETSFALNQLHAVGAISADDPFVRRSLDRIWSAWSPTNGVSASSYWSLPDVDDTLACFWSLRWGGYTVDTKVFDPFEAEEYFCGYPGETNPSPSCNVRLLGVLRENPDEDDNPRRIEKLISVMHRLDENGSFWSDKWQASPYYTTGQAVIALDGIADDLALTRLKWIIRTQNDDGGWGYFGRSTVEETSYCLRALLHWQRKLGTLDRMRIEVAANYMIRRLGEDYYPPMWIAKSLYTPLYIVKAAILSALYDYLTWTGRY